MLRSPQRRVACSSRFKNASIAIDFKLRSLSFLRILILSLTHGAATHRSYSGPPADGALGITRSEALSHRAHRRASKEACGDSRRVLSARPRAVRPLRDFNPSWSCTLHSSSSETTAPGLTCCVKASFVLHNLCIRACLAGS
jgi:hypothetical protein